MGFLTDPDNVCTPKWQHFFRKTQSTLSLILYIVAIAWLGVISHNEFNNATYFSENALLPGLVANEFNGGVSAKQYYYEFIDELQEKYSDTEEMPVPWLVGKMSQLHLEVYTHNFTLNYPMGQGQVYKGTNVYGILRAARTPSLEAMVVTAPYRSLESHQKGTAAGIALMLAYAQFAKPQNYWAKDIIFLVTEHEQLGMQAWLEAYHGIKINEDNFYSSLGSFWDPSISVWDFKKLTGFDYKEERCLNPGTLKGRSGAIQAAINLEFHAPEIKYVEVKLEGLNGQLPNLDLSNLVHKMCEKAGIHHSFKHSYSWVNEKNKHKQWYRNFMTMASMIATQAPGVPNGNHGLFHRFSIEALTLEGRDASDPAGMAPKVKILPASNFYRLGIVLDSTMRSINNLLERFHQSYFFYLLLSSSRFVSIGQYMPSLCLPIAAILIKALWFATSKTNDDTATEISEKSKKNKTNEEIKSKVLEAQTPEGIIRKSNDSEVNYTRLGLNYLLVHGIGYVVMNSPFLLTKIGTIYDKPSEVSVYYGFLVITMVLFLLTPLIPRILSKGSMNTQELILTNTLVLIELATVCLCVGMQNFSLGMCIAFLYTPIALVVNVENRTGRFGYTLLWLQRLMCIIVQPLIGLSIGMMAYSHILFPEEPTVANAGRGIDAAMLGIMFSIVDSMIYGNWLFNVIASFILPIWIIFWQLLTCSIKK